MRAWRARSDYQPEWRIVTDFVDEHWDATERDRVASYLEQGLSPWAALGVSVCRFCGAGHWSTPSGSSDSSATTIWNW
ncbi:MAG: hypothetical protein ACLQFR_01835 [Streptosporangiaceae bacterium]